MNYIAGAKIGILVFTDNIHDTYIGTSGWKANTWNWLMSGIGKSGWTLVNVVDAALGAIGDAVEAVKSAKDYVVNAVKDGLNYLVNSVLVEIVRAFASGLNLAFQGIIIMLSELLGFPYSIVNGLIEINNLKLGIENSGLSLEIFSGDSKIIIDNPFALSGPIQETLSVNNLIVTSTGFHLIFNTLTTAIGGTNVLHGTLTAIFSALLQAVTFATFKLSQGSFTSDERDQLMLHYFIAFMTSLGSGLLGIAPSIPGGSIAKDLAWMMSYIFGTFITVTFGVGLLVENAISLSNRDLGSTFANFAMLAVSLTIMMGIENFAVNPMQGQISLNWFNFLNAMVYLALVILLGNNIV